MNSTASELPRSPRLEYADLLTRWLMRLIKSEETDRAEMLEALRKLGEMAPHLRGLPRTPRELEAFSPPEGPDETWELENLIWQAMYDSLGRSDKVFLPDITPKERAPGMEEEMFGLLALKVLQ